MKLFFPLLVLPLLAQENYSVEKERALGNQLASEVRRQSSPLADPAVVAYLQRVGGELISKLPEQSFAYHFEALSDSNATEPFGVPGGYVFVPARAFVDSQNEAEFVGMLAHSIAHVSLRHGTRMATRGQVVNTASIPLIFVGGSHGTHAESRPAADLLVPVGFRKFQRAQELEADSIGVTLSAQAGYDPRAYRAFIERAQVPDSEFSALPDRATRLTRLQEAISSLPTISSPSSAEFLRVQEVVRGLVPKVQSQVAPTLRR